MSECVYVCVGGGGEGSSPHNINVSSAGSHMERSRLKLTMTVSHMTSELQESEEGGGEDIFLSAQSERKAGLG